MRTFEGGATRDQDRGKLDYEGFLSPLVLERFARYMNRHRETAVGERASDNWQRGIPRDVYMKSLWRHFVDAWKGHRGWPCGVSLEEALCAVLFNAQGYLHELLASQAGKPEQATEEAESTVRSWKVPLEEPEPESGPESEDLDRLSTKNRHVVRDHFDPFAPRRVLLPTPSVPKTPEPPEAPDPDDTFPGDLRRLDG